MDMLEIHCTFRAHHCRVEENTPRNLEIAILLKGFHLDCAQEAGIIVH